MMEQEHKYWPYIKGGTPKRFFRFGDYIAVLSTDMESPGDVTYLYILAVFRRHMGELCLCIASEENKLYGIDPDKTKITDSGGSHFLGLFPGQGHINFGSSNDWADLEKFTMKALEIALQELGVDEVIEELPPA